MGWGQAKHMANRVSFPHAKPITHTIPPLACAGAIWGEFICCTALVRLGQNSSIQGNQVRNNGSSGYHNHSWIRWGEMFFLNRLSVHFALRR